MHAGALRALEFDRIVDAVCAHAQTPMGAARVAALTPFTEAARVARALAATSEAARFLQDNQVGIQAPAGFEEVLTALSVEGRALEPGQLLSLASFLGSVDTTAAGVRRARLNFPILRGIADTVASFERETTDVRRKIDPAGPSRFQKPDSDSSSRALPASPGGQPGS